MNHGIHHTGSQFMRGLNIVIKGAGGQATGIAHRLHRAGLTRILMTDIADTILQGETILYVDETPIIAAIDGTLRGLIRDIVVKEGEKIGDIDPRGRIEHCYTISDKARAIGGGVLEAVMADFNNR
jgi:xanthine dehydrogenase accessory factor